MSDYHRERSDDPLGKSFRSTIYEIRLLLFMLRGSHNPAAGVSIAILVCEPKTQFVERTNGRTLVYARSTRHKQLR